MNGVIRKLAAVLLAVAMVTAFTPFYGTGCIVNAENEDVVASQTDGGSDLNEEVEITGETPAAEDAEADQSGDMDSADLNAAELEADLQTKEDSNADDVSSEAGGSITDQEEKANVKLDANNDDVPVAVRGAGDSDPAGDDPGDGEEDPFEGVQSFGLERVGGGPNIIYDDGTVSFRITDEAALNVEGVTRYAGFVGVPGPDGWEEIKDCYTYDDSTKTITVDGRIIAAQFPDHSAPGNIGVQISGEDDDRNLKMIAGFNNGEFRYSEEFYEFPEDRNLLPGWDGSINGRYEVFVKNTEHPDGEKLPLEVTNVEAIEGRDLLEEFKADSDDNGNRWWYYKAGRQNGTVMFKITYNDNYKGTEGNIYETQVNVVGDVYEAYMGVDDDITTLLPGEDIGFSVFGLHKYTDDEGNEQITQDGLEYVWSIIDGGDFARIEANNDEPWRATLFIDELDENEEFFDRGVEVKVSVRDNASDDTGMERVSQTRWINVRSDYTEIYPAGLNSDLAVGDVIENQKFELRHYDYRGTAEDGFNDEGYKLIDGAEYEWFDLDENAVKITGDGDTFTIKRLSDYYTEFTLKANLDENSHFERHYRFFDQRYDTWFDEHDIDYFGDADYDPEFRLNVEQFGENFDSLYNYEVTAGEWDGRNDRWKNTLASSVYDVSYDSESNRIVVRFDRGSLDLSDYKDIRIVAEISPKDNDVDLHRDADAWLHIKKVKYEVNWDDHVNMLPGWGDNIPEKFDAWIENSEFPQGENRQLPVTGVLVKEGEEFLDVIPTEENNWLYEAGKGGHVVLEISYEDEHGDQQIHEMEIDITGDVYEIRIRNAALYDQGLPGSSMELSAEAAHKYLDNNGNYQENTKGLSYEWSIEQGRGFAKLMVHEDDPSKATLKFNELPQGEDWIDEEIRIRVEVRDSASDNPDAECASCEETYWVRSEFEEIWPADIGRLNVGESTGDFRLEVRRYSVNDSNVKVFEVEKASWGYDTNALQITCDDGKQASSGDEMKTDTFSIYRLTERGTNVNLRVWYKNDKNEPRDRDIDYWLENLNYDVWFINREENVFDNDSLNVDLQTRSDLDYSGIDLRFSTEGYRWDDDADDYIEVDVPEECWSSNGYTVSVDGSKLEEAGIDKLLVKANAYIGDREICREAKCRVKLCHTCAAHGEKHLWLSAPAEYKNCTSKGTMKQICWKCLEKRIVSVAPRGHLPKKTAMKASTATKEGNVDYWVCSDCKKYFFDAKCTKAASKDLVIIPRGTTIAKVTPQSKGFTVTWKKPAAAYLKHTTGYQVIYALNTKFTSGKKVVTISKNGTVSAKVTKLYAKKKYYIRVRTYRLINGKYYYSPWSQITYTTTK